MPIGTDFEIQNDKDIRYIGAAHGASGAGYYTVIEFHRWLQDLADDAVAAGDDYMDITRQTPSERSTDNIVTLINGFNIDDAASEHLFDGSIIQTGGAEIYDGILIYANAGMDLQIVQNGAVLANDFWNTVPFGETLKGLNANAANGISHRFMLKTRTGAADIDGRRLICQTRVWFKTFSEFRVNGTARGNNVAALTYADDLNNTTAEATAATWTTIANSTEGYVALDVNNDSTPEFYYSEWDKDIYTINQFYERMKYISRQGTAATLYGLNGEIFRGITHEIDVDTPTGTFNAFEPVSWTGGTGQMLAINSPTAPTKMWIQLLTGLAPTDGQTITGTTSTATADVNVTVTERTLSYPFCGVSTGSALIGAYGFSLEVTDLTAADKVFDLTNTQRTPPNYVTFTVNGLVSGEDRVLVGPATGANLNEAQFSLNATLNADDIVAVVIGTAIPSDTPAAGYIRVEDDNGVYRRLHYSSWTGSTFTIDTTDGNEDFATVNATAGNNVFIAYIDVVATAAQESFTSVYLSDRSLFIRVRDGGGTPIKTFETTGTLGSAGGSSTAIRTSDE